MKIKIAVKNLQKLFCNRVIIDNISFDVMEKDSVAIIGSSGAGKSVLMKMISGNLTYDSGVVEIDGQDISMIKNRYNSSIFDQIGFVFQNCALFDSLNVFENIVFKLQNKYLYKKSALQEIALEALKIVDLKESVMKMRVHELSGGMKKRVAIARTIASRPKIIFFDEPTTGLDPITTSIVTDLILKCREFLDATSITITHDVNSAEILSNKVLFLNKGSIQWSGETRYMRHNSNDVLHNFIHGMQSFVEEN